MPRVILEILYVHGFCNLIDQEHTQMCRITFILNLWKKLLFLWISLKRHLKLFYHFEVLLTQDQTYLVVSMDIYLKKLTLCFNSFIKYWTFENPAIWSVQKIFDNETQPKNFAWRSNWNGKSNITIILLSYFFSGS